MAALAVEGFIVIEEGPLNNVDPTTLHFDRRNDALDYITSRQHLFSKTELAKVLMRVTVTMVPKVAVEGEETA